MNCLYCARTCNKYEWKNNEEWLDCTFCQVRFRKADSTYDLIIMQRKVYGRDFQIFLWTKEKTFELIEWIRDDEIHTYFGHDILSFDFLPHITPQNVVDKIRTYILFS